MVSFTVSTLKAKPNPANEGISPWDVRTGAYLVSAIIPKSKEGVNPMTILPLTYCPELGFNTTGLPLEPGIVAPSIKNPRKIRFLIVPSGSS